MYRSWVTVISMIKAYRLHASLGYHLSLAARIQERRLEEGLKNLDLTRTTWCILLAIGNENLKQPSDIASFVGIDRTATSRALKQMQSQGLVAKESGQSDKRTREIALTNLGQEKLLKGSPIALHNNRAMEERLSEADRDVLLRLLQKTHEGEMIDLAKL